MRPFRPNIVVPADFSECLSYEQQLLWLKQLVDNMVSELVPPGGNEGQLLAKASDSDFDTEWVDADAGGQGPPGPPGPEGPPGKDAALPTGTIGQILVADDNGVLQLVNPGKIAPNQRANDLLVAVGADRLEWAAPEDALPGLFSDYDILHSTGAVGNVLKKTNKGIQWGDSGATMFHEYAFSNSQLKFTTNTVIVKYGRVGDLGRYYSFLSSIVGQGRILSPNGIIELTISYTDNDSTQKDTTVRVPFLVYDSFRGDPFILPKYEDTSVDSREVTMEYGGFCTELNAYFALLNFSATAPEGVDYTYFTLTLGSYYKQVTAVTGKMVLSSIPYPGG